MDGCGEWTDGCTDQQANTPSSQISAFSSLSQAPVPSVLFCSRGPPQWLSLCVEHTLCALCTNSVSTATTPLRARRQTGPWRWLLVRRGYDPRQAEHAPDARRFQLVEYALPPR
eukprot:350436-Chlamydomonas_euryale.AAC.1